MEYSAHSRPLGARQENSRKRVKCMRMIIDVIDIYLTYLAVVLLVCRVYMVVALMIVRFGMVFDREDIVKFSHCRGVEEYTQQ
jgi:hypothetical protein